VATNARRKTRRKPVKKTVEDVHSVKAALHVHSLSKAGTSLKLIVYAHKEKIGEIVLGRGSLFWRGANRQKQKRISWTRFAEMMDELAYE
jgi:hypothetical protein